jgi:hypothetical protein
MRVALAQPTKPTQPTGTTGTAQPVQSAPTTVQTDFTITSASDLATDIQLIDQTGADAAANTAYTFTFDLPGGATTLDITQIDAINLESGSSLTVIGNGDTIDGQGTQRGLFVYAGTVTVEDLTIANMIARGGDGGASDTGAGGGGAGLGGGLFVANGAAVTLVDVDFSGDGAVGGNGTDNGPEENGARAGGGGGGGMGGNGASLSSGGGGGGGIGVGANGGHPFTSHGGSQASGAGIIPGTPGSGGGGGYYSPFLGGRGAGGGGVGGQPPSPSGFFGYQGGAGGFGGGGGGGGAQMLPVCIKAGAIEENVPARDLWISPHHAMYLDGVLIEAKDLINGFSIVRAERIDKVEYVHVELDTHDVIFAEGAASETFLDDDSRGMFHNADEFRVLYPNEPGAGFAHYCAPRLDEGYEVEAVRERLRHCAGAASVVA